VSEASGDSPDAGAKPEASRLGCAYIPR
jgi:hypothetical protein